MKTSCERGTAERTAQQQASQKLSASSAPPDAAAESCASQDRISQYEEKTVENALLSTLATTV
jgi:hypothetical protein